jgi:hypothetical protein
MAARATVRNTGSSSMTASRVAGREPLKISTPMKPLIQPAVVLSMPRPFDLPAPYLLRRLARPVTVRYNLAELLCWKGQYG